MTLRDVTSARVCFGLWGPRARDILAAITRDDVSDAAFPYLTARRSPSGRAPPRAPRHLRRRARLGAVRPAEYGRALWTTLWEAGRPHGMVAGGYRAIDALRLEKGYRVWSTDITPGRDAVRGRPRLRRRARQGARVHRARRAGRREGRGPAQRLRCLVLDDPRSVCLGNEPVRVDGEIVGRVTSGGYGFAVERSIAYAYLPPERAAIGTRGEVEVFGEWIGFEVAREPLYDPDGARIRA